MPIDEINGYVREWCDLVAKCPDGAIKALSVCGWNDIVGQKIKAGITDIVFSHLDDVIRQYIETIQNIDFFVLEQTLANIEHHLSNQNTTQW